MRVNIVDKIADRIRWGYLTAFIVLLCSYILSYYSTQQLLKQANWLNHTNSIINNLNVLESMVKDAESSFRGYVIIKDEKFLDKYNNSTPGIDSLFKELKSLTANNPGQLKKLDSLGQLIKEKFYILSAGLAIFKQHDYQLTDSMKILAYKGKHAMEQVGNIMRRMQSQENQAMAKRAGRLSSFSDFIKIINIASLIVAILLTFYSIVTFTKENRAKKQADLNAKVFREQLEMRVKELADVNKELLELRSIEKFAVTGRISRAIAHEVRNPLTNINLAAEHLRSEIASTPETDLLLEMVTRNSNRINQLISDLLNTTKVTQLDFAKVSLNHLLDESLQFAQDRLELKGIKVIKNYTADLCDILADQEKLQIAFLNIIVNAIEAMERDKGILQIKTFNKNDRCVAVITDNGIGMSKEHLSKLFEPYFTTKENGTGLGLAHTQNIIISHRASISAESEVGKGTSFTVSLNYA
ncbi:MAG: CHASE3 domain-containing protein [Ginsengibacter sp.]